MTIDFHDSGKVRLQKLIRESSLRQELTADKYTLGPPTPNTLHDRNTVVIIHAADGVTVGPVANKRTLFYNRTPLSERFPDGVSLTTIPTSIGSVHDLLGAILEEHGVNILPEDVEDTPYYTFPVTLSATAQSYGWLGSTTIRHSGDVVPDTILLDGGGYFLLDSGAILLNN